MLDNYELWQRKEAEAEKWLQKRPECDYCQEHIQDDHYFEINGDVICFECLEAHFRKEIYDYSE